MATATDLMRREIAEIGYCRWDDPEQGTKYGRWMAELFGEPWIGTNGIAYCDIFQSWAMAMVGQSCAGLPGYNVPNTLAACRKAGLVLADKRAARYGDLVFYDWNGNGSPDHIGAVELVSGSYVQSVEGNTTGADGRSGSVARRTRSWGTVLAVARPPYSGQSPVVAKLEVDGLWGTATTLRAQEVLDAPYKDARISRQNSYWKPSVPGCTLGWEWMESGYGEGSQTIAMLQEIWGAEPDGLLGVDTINAMIGYYMARGSGATAKDGKLDYPSLTVKAFQRRLNEGKI